MKRTCARCHDIAGKGNHYVTVKVASGTTKHNLSTCEGCGKLLQQRISDVITNWSRKED